LIEKQTIFILGAGASVPYGYPTGLQLRKQIIENLDVNKRTTNIENPNLLLRKMLLQEKYDESTEFKTNLLESRRSSVDAFLENRRNFCAIGKLAITCGIIESENSEKGPWDWFEYLHDAELAHCHSAEEYCQNNNVDFITFNYDRHLEHSLMNSLKSTYGNEKEECAELIRENIEIVHVHGKLDDLPWENDNGREYGDMPSSLTELERSSKGIKIIHEKIEKKCFGNARKLIKSSDLIVFLGLNLHNQINLDRLNIKDNLEEKTIYGTIKGLSGPQKEKVKEYFNDKLNEKVVSVSGRRRPVGGFDALEFLQEEARFQ